MYRAPNESIEATDLFSLGGNEKQTLGKPQSIIRVNNDVAIMMVETGV